MLDFIFKRDKKINAVIITKQAKIIFITKYPDSSTFEWNKGSYIINKESRLTKSNIPCFIYIEGIPDAINFNTLKKPSDLKIDSEGLKAVLKAKLFYELFNDQMQNIKDIIFYILIGLTIVGLGYIAFTMNKNLELTNEIKNLIIQYHTNNAILGDI